MTNDPASLDRLHGLVLPAPVPWWPPAVGLQVLLVLVTLACLAGLWKWWCRYRDDAYRREALQLLAQAGDAKSVAELLKRTALAVVPREVVADLDGEAWADWLVLHSKATLSPRARQQLLNGPYTATRDEDAFQELHAFAACWVCSHQRPEDPTEERRC